MSVEAMTWALNLAPVPMDKTRKGFTPSQACAFVLVALANHAGPDGTDAFPSVETIARYTRMSENTVRTARDRLLAAGIIREGDPAVVAAKIKRGDRRTKVYNLAMERVREDLTEDQLRSIGEQNPWLKPITDKAIEDARRGSTTAPRELDGVQPLNPVRPSTTEPRTPDGVQPLSERGSTTEPEPSLEPSEEIHPPTGGDARVAHTREGARERIARGDRSAAALVALWLEIRGEAKRPPQRIVGQVSKLLKDLLDEGIDFEDVKTGLSRWDAKPKLSPSYLVNFVDEVQRESRHGVTAANGYRIPTTQARVQAGMSLAEQLRAEENGHPGLLAIGGDA